MSEQKRYMNLSLDAPYSSTPASYDTQDDLLDAMDAYIEECEAQNEAAVIKNSFITESAGSSSSSSLCGLTQYENSLYE